MNPPQMLDNRNESREADTLGSALLDAASRKLATVRGEVLIVVPVRNLVLFPGMIVPIAIERESSLAAAQHAIRGQRPVGILMQCNPEAQTAGPDDLFRVGTSASILRYVTTPDGAHHIVCQGLQRFRVTSYLDGFPFILAKTDRIFEDRVPDEKEIEARFMRLKESAVEVLQLLPQVPQEMINAVQSAEVPGALADLVAGYVDIKVSEKQELLEEFDLRRRLDRVIEMLVHRIEVLNLARDIDWRTKASLGQREREFLLREQLKAIQKELGDDGGGNAAELGELRQMITGVNMPEEVARQADKELKRLERMSDGSAEYSMLRTYLDWMIELPWKTPEADAINLSQAKRVLDEDHFGLDQVKKRILELLAVRKLKPGGQGPILCLVGPPGVGKTSLGQSIARALGRKFARVSLGGVHDEAEIRGHRRTYIGALPGNVIQALKKAATRGCVMMLDEIDKLGTGLHGDPAAALLEVLDPGQNNSFRDNYLAVPFDLSQVLFIATANILDPIPGPLRDRMEVLHLAGYTREEKREIARKYLVTRQMSECGLKPGQLAITDMALATMVRDYTREAGVRGLERQIGAVCRRAAVRFAEGDTQAINIDSADLAEILGPAKFENEVALRSGLPGIATGLAWTPVGGDILFIEASRTPGSGRLILTGQLGDVMKESAQAALTLVKSRVEALRLNPVVFRKSDVHIHVPAGAIPKDGPSAGVAMFISLASLFMNKPVRSDIAMTGEISLRGLVLPIGGVKEKVLAALAAGIQRVILPARNQKDLEDVPRHAREDLEFIFVDNVEDAARATISTDHLTTTRTNPPSNLSSATPPVA